MKRVLTFFWIFLALFFLAVLFSGQIHRVRGKTAVPGTVMYELTGQALRSLKRHDVPVGAVITYDDQIIGRGHNTVLRDRDPSGHAEVNALREAMKKSGYKEFMALDRSKLVLYSTFEPCEMCMGTLEHYNVRNVIYLKEKSLLAGWKRQIKGFYHQLRKRQAEGGALQDSLFLLHPNYPGK